MFMQNQTVSQLVWPFLGLFQSELEITISGFWRAESETRSAKRHVNTARREYKSRDRRASEFELRISVANVSHVIFACRESERRGSEFELELNRVPDRNIRGTLLQKNSRKLK